MSLRIDTSELISGALVIGETGLGVLGSNIPATGEDYPSIFYEDLSLPADAGKEIRGLLLTPPASGTLFVYEDGSFSFAAPDGSYWFTYRLYADGSALNTATVSIIIGDANRAVAVTEALTATATQSCTTAAQPLVLESASALDTVDASQPAYYTKSQTDSGNAVDVVDGLAGVPVNYGVSVSEAAAAADEVATLFTKSTWWAYSVPKKSLGYSI